MRIYRDGFDEPHAPRSNRARGQDDRSVLGRGHGFGPRSSGPGRGRRDDMRFAGDRPDENPRAARDYGRIASHPGRRGALRDDDYDFGSTAHEGYGSRSRSFEGRRRPVEDAKDFDRDLRRS